MPADPLVPSSRLDATPGWDAFFEQVEQVARERGAAAYSLGVVQAGRVLTYNHGFSERTSTRFAQVPLTAPLPGPAALRSGEPTYLEDHRQTEERFPAAALIHQGTPYEAAACLLLPATPPAPAQGYLALHYVGPRGFTADERSRLDESARGVADRLTRLLHVAAAEACTDLDQMTPDRLRGELRGLHEAMRSRAVIEQAKGVLMGRFHLDEHQAWQLLCRWSSERNLKVRVIAQAVVDDVRRGG